MHNACISTAQLWRYVIFDITFCALWQFITWRWSRPRRTARACCWRWALEPTATPTAWLSWSSAGTAVLTGTTTMP